MNIGIFGDSFAEDHLRAAELIHKSEIVPWIKNTLGIDIDQFIC